MSGSTSPKLAPNLHGALRDVRDVYIFAPKRGFDQLPVLYLLHLFVVLPQILLGKLIENAKRKLTIPECHLKLDGVRWLLAGYRKTSSKSR